MDDCVPLGFAGYEGLTDASLVSSLGSLMDARDVTASARDQQRVYFMTESIVDAVHSISVSQLETKETNEVDSVVSSGSIVLLSRKVESKYLGASSVIVPKVGGAVRCYPPQLSIDVLILSHSPYSHHAIITAWGILRLR